MGTGQPPLHFRNAEKTTVAFKQIYNESSQCRQVSKIRPKPSLGEHSILTSAFFDENLSLVSVTSRRFLKEEISAGGVTLDSDSLISEQFCTTVSIPLAPYFS